MNFPAFNIKQPHIPVDRIRHLSRLWAGKGSLHEWLVPNEWKISRSWSSEVVQARFAESVLWDAEHSIAPRLPSGLAAWMDQFEAQTIRNIIYTDLPTPHTDWALTLSKFGRYPSPKYVDRKPTNTLESALSRVSLWLGKMISKAELLVLRTFGRKALSDSARTKLMMPAQVAKILELTSPAELHEEDLAVCASTGGLWLLIARLARQLFGIWKNDASTQLAALPSLLPELGSQLFELATLGTCSITIANMLEKADWASMAPIGASEKSMPCLVSRKGNFTWEAYYQTIPTGRRAKNAPYETLGAPLNVSSLRPDIWLIFNGEKNKTELIVESKYSLNTSYVASGINQILGYSLEFPKISGYKRLYMIVAPIETVSVMSSWNDCFFLGNLDHLSEVIKNIDFR